VPILATITVLAVLSGLGARDFVMLGVMLAVTLTLALLRRPRRPLDRSVTDTRAR
jgi:hypothetical protein